MRIFLGILALIVVIAIAAWAIDIDVSGDVELPEVEMTGGEMPAVDAEVVDIDVEERQVDVPVPDVDVNMEEEQVNVPVITTDAPEENTVAEEDDLDGDADLVTNEQN